MVENKELVGMLENIHLLRKFFLMRTSAESPLHFSQIAIMKMIEQNENCTQTEIAEQLGVTPASVATSTKRLQKAGLITKTVDEENQRCKRLALTDTGREAIEMHIGLFREYDKEVFSVFSDDEKEKLMDYLSRIVRKIQSMEGLDKEAASPFELSVYLRKTMGDFPENKT